MKVHILIGLIAVMMCFSEARESELSFEYQPARDLRSRSSGGSRSYSGSSKSYSGSKSSSYSKPKTTKITYTKTKQTRVTTNSYFSNGVTYGPLYSYYRPIGFVAVVGYYSPIYSRQYYDGYGYNFYYGQYGYYEYSVNPRRASSLAAEILYLLILLCLLRPIVRHLKFSGNTPWFTTGQPTMLRFIRIPSSTRPFPVPVSHPSSETSIMGIFLNGLGLRED